MSEKKVRGLHVLLVDDEVKIRQLLSSHLGMDGFTVATASSAEEARAMLEASDYDIVVTDLRMDGMGGMGLLAWLQEEGPAIPAIVISAYGDVSDAVEAMHRGAVDYLVKPFEASELSLRIERSVRNWRLERSLRLRQKLSGNLPASTGQQSAFGDVVRVPGLLESANPAMRAILDMARKASPSGASILITGESGTGKEVLASWIHGLSDRGAHPFVPVNLGGLPETLLETELFGHEKGAFTGADRRKTGMFELANGGTLFLDEIGDMPLHLQVKILRVLQDRRIQRLGSTVTLPIDVRIIAATHRDLVKEVKEGRFREDLFFRINVIPLKLPPLRDRLEDLPAFVRFIMEKHMKPGSAAGLSEDALESLRGYAFPGNIRELENMLERALILCEGSVLRARDFNVTQRHESSARISPEAPNSPDAPPQGTPLAVVERWAILRELEAQSGRRQATADALGISRRTLLNKLTEYGMAE